MRSLLVALTLAAPLAFAQAQPRQPKTELTFEGDLIEGTDQRPDVELVDSAKAPKHTSLVKVRETFRREVLESVNQL